MCSCAFERLPGPLRDPTQTTCRRTSSTTLSTRCTKISAAQLHRALIILSRSPPPNVWRGEKHGRGKCQRTCQKTHASSHQERGADSMEVRRGAQPLTHIHSPCLEEKPPQGLHVTPARCKPDVPCCTGTRAFARFRSVPGFCRTRRKPRCAPSCRCRCRARSGGAVVR